MESQVNVLLQQQCQLFLVIDPADLLSQVLQNGARIVSAAKEGPVDALRGVPQSGRRNPGQNQPKPHADRHGDSRIRLEQPGKQNHNDHIDARGQQNHQQGETTPHQHIAGAAS